MIITCPHCSSRYRVKDELIKAKGKRIRCKKCSAVFVAYPDKPEVLEKAPNPTGKLTREIHIEPVAKEASASSAATPPSQAAAPQATVRVDRSQLDQFIKEQGTPAAAPAASAAPEQPSSTVKVDPEQFQKFLTEQNQGSPPPQDIAAGATVQVDRSQINAFLQESSQPPSETVQVDPDTLSNLLEREQGPKPDLPNLSGGDTVQVDPSTLSNLMQQHPPGTAGEPSAAPIPSSSTLDAAVGEEPAFPSDEELGISGGVNLTAPTEHLPFTAPVPPAPSDNTEPPPAPAPEASNASGPLFQAEVDGNVYPHLQLDAIERWIREGRLIEGDRLAPNGSNDYRPAESYPAIAEFFSKYAEEYQQEEAEPPKKKGFFARLFSFGK